MVLKDRAKTLRVRNILPSEPSKDDQQGGNPSFIDKHSIEDIKNLPDIIPDEYSFIGNEEEIMDYVMPLSNQQNSKSINFSMSKSSITNRSRSKNSMDATSINQTVKMG